MAVTFLAGFETKDATAEGFTVTGGLIATSTARTGSWGWLVNPGFGSAAFITLNSTGPFVHFGLQITSAPSVERLIFGAIATGTINVRMQPDRSLKVYLNATLIGQSAILALLTWYWIGVRQLTGTSVAFLQIDGVASVTGTATVSATSAIIGASGTEAASMIFAIDDVIVDNAGFLAPSKVNLLVPTADSARSAGWVGGAGGTTALWDAVNNKPPVGVADTGTDTSQIRNATAEANGSYDATMTTYSVAGVASGDTVLAVQPIVATAAPVTTSSKQGTVGVVSNPAIANVALGAGGTAGAFWSGLAGSTYPTGWKASFGTIAASPSVAVGTAPVMRVTQVTSSTRIADVCFMGMQVAWTPSGQGAGTGQAATATGSGTVIAAGTDMPWISPYPSVLAQ